MTDHTNTYPDLVSVEDWLNAKGYTGEAGACHQAMSLIRSQEKRIAELKEALKDCADDLEAELLGRYVVGAENFIHPARQTAFDRDMATVRAARAAYLGERDG